MLTKDISIDLFRKMNKFKIKNDMIYYGNLIYIPEKLRLEILMKYHEKPAAGHFVK